MRIALPLAIGFAVYGTYWFLIFGILGGGYEEELVLTSARLLTAAGLWSHVQSAYVATFWQGNFLLPFLLIIVYFLYQDRIDNLGTNLSRLISSMGLFLLVAALPILSLIYINELHIRDPDRVLFPVSVGFTLLCLSLYSQSRNGYLSPTTALRAAGVVTVVLVASGSGAVEIWRHGQYQKIVLNKTLAAISISSSQSLVIRDTTGVLGDVYTLLGTTLRDAMAVHGRHIAATICTPLSVDRLHPDARRYPIKSTGRCEELPATFHNALILTARWEDGKENGKLTLGP